MSKNVPTNPSLYSRVKSEAKRKFDRWPSAYGSAWLVKEYKRRGGKYRKAEEGMEVPDYSMPYMATGGKMPQWLANARFSAAGNEDKKADYGYHLGGIVTPAEQMQNLQIEQAFMNPFEDEMRYGGEEMYAAGGSIPERYKNMGFNKVGVKKKSTRPGKKWMVLAKKGDKYKVVHGGDSKMKDFTQHGSNKRKDRFWDRMGGRDSAKAKDPFSPLYWHKKFGTWEQGGENFNEDSQDFYQKGRQVKQAFNAAVDLFNQWSAERHVNRLANPNSIYNRINQYSANRDAYHLSNDYQPFGWHNPLASKIGPSVEEAMAAINAATAGAQGFQEQPFMQSRMRELYPSSSYLVNNWKPGTIVNKFGQGGQPCFECGGSYMEDGGWIQKATERMKAKGTVGAFTKQAKRAGYDSVQSFANHVLKNTDDYTSTTVKRAQFAKNMGNLSKAAYGMQLPKHQGLLGPSQVGSGMFGVWQQDQQMQDIYDQMEAEQQAAQQANPQQQPAFVPGMGTIDWMNWNPNDTSFGNMKIQYETVEDRMDQPYGVFQKNVEALGLPSTGMSNSGVREERNLSWMAPAANIALGVAGAYARGVENRRRQDEFATRTAADNVFAMAPQGLPGDRGDYDANTGFFRPDEMGFKNDARYWNPYVAQASIYRAEQGGQFGTVDEQLLQELIAAGADIEIID